MIRSGIIFQGYAEDNTIAGVPVYHSIGFNSVEEYLAHLGKTVLEAFRQEQELIEWKCCKEAKKNKTNIFCPICGHKLKLNKLTEKEGFAFMRSFLNGTCDSLGTFWQDIEAQDWIFGSKALKEVVQHTPIIEVFEYGTELLWYCSQDQAEKRMTDKTAYSAVLKDHVEFLGFSNPRPLIYAKT